MEYEVLMEHLQPCGSPLHRQQQFWTVDAQSPEQYVAKMAKLPILSVSKTKDGTTILTGDDTGNQIRYTFRA